MLKKQTNKKPTKFSILCALYLAHNNPFYFLCSVLYQTWSYFLISYNVAGLLPVLYTWASLWTNQNSVHYIPYSACALYKVLFLLFFFAYTFSFAPLSLFFQIYILPRSCTMRPCLLHKHTKCFATVPEINEYTHHCILLKIDRITWKSDGGSVWPRGYINIASERFITHSFYICCLQRYENFFSYSDILSSFTLKLSDL